MLSLDGYRLWLEAERNGNGKLDRRLHNAAPRQISTKNAPGVQKSNQFADARQSRNHPETGFEEVGIDVRERDLWPAWPYWFTSELPFHPPGIGR
jgi:hypothetical protein